MYSGKHKQHVTANISKFELNFYFLIWFFSIGYAIYRVFNIGNDYFSNEFEDIYNDFSKDWSWIGRKKDNSDTEWYYGLNLLKILAPWYCVHIICTEIVRKINKSLLPLWYASFGLYFVHQHLGYKPLMYFLVQPFVFHLALRFRRMSVIWICNIAMLISIHYIDKFTPSFTQFSSYKKHFIGITLSWINLRCLNYYLDATKKLPQQKFTFKNITTALAYCFYLPLLFFGPLILYSDFKCVFECSNQNNLFTRLKELTVSLLRFVWWLIFTEFVLHFVYVNALSYQTEVIKRMNVWSLYGLGYCMGQFFHLKYVVFYGISTSISHFEGIPVPGLPKCIGRIHMYSDMWKYFDQGLYQFLVRYIYIPFCGLHKSALYKLFSSFLCFSYVYIWHGLQNFIAIWSLMNYLGIAIETLSYNISQTSIYQRAWRNTNTQMYRRFICVMASPLFAMSALSNFYFFAGKDVGDIYVYRFINGSLGTSITILAVLYCGCHISIEIKKWESSKNAIKLKYR